MYNEAFLWVFIRNIGMDITEYYKTQAGENCGMS